MNIDDKVRELDKAIATVNHAVNYHMLTNEANAHLHLADKTMYAPLTTSLKNALDSIVRVRNELNEERQADV